MILIAESVDVRMASEVHNTTTSREVSAVVQAGSVHGDIHLSARAAETPVIPRQLPIPPRSFVARERELTRLDAIVAADAGEMAVLVVEGTGGVGKTTLALHWAHHNLGQFPDGQLHVDLRGFDPARSPVPAEAAVHGFLVALGVEPAAIPAELGAAAALYRSVIAGKQALVLLDNAFDTNQVVPLLPGTPSCTVLVTSRHHLSGLTIRGARFVKLDVLGDSDSRALLRRHLPNEVLTADPDAVRTLLDRCAGLPLALAIVAARTAEHPEFPVSVLADELREESVGLDAFDSGEESANLRAVLSWSSGSLDEEQSRTFRLLGIAPVADIELTAVANLLAVPVGEASRRLRALETRNLVQQHKPRRFRMHDLVRRHAAELAGAADSLTARVDALRRLVRFYVHTARLADHLLYPHRSAEDPPAMADGASLLPMADERAALIWFAEEHRQLLAIQQTAVRENWVEEVWHISFALDTYQYRMGLLQDNITTSRLGLAAAENIGSDAMRASSLRRLGRAYTRAGQTDEAVSCLRQALELVCAVGDREGEGHAHHDMQRAYSRRGDHVLALEHARSALAAYEVSGNPVGQAHSLNALGRQHAELEQYEQARRCCESAVTLHEENNNPSGLLSTLETLGFVARRTGHYEEAVRHCGEALRLAHELDNRFALGTVTEALADVLALQGKHAEARLNLQQAHDIFAAQHRLLDAERVRGRLK